MLSAVIKQVHIRLGDRLIAGTLTMNHMTITKVFTLEREDILEVEKSVDAITSLGNESAVKRVLRIGNLCNNAHRGEFNKLVGQATDVALIDILHKFQLEDIRPVSPSSTTDVDIHSSLRDPLLLRQKVDGRHRKTVLCTQRRRLVHQRRRRGDPFPL